jgi:N-acetylneuraminic acid mutarotase
MDQRYFGGGALTISQSSLVSTSKNFWKYENNNFVKLPDLPFVAVNAVSFELNEKLFVMGGLAGSGTEAYKFNVTSQQWQEIDNAPFVLNKNVLTFQHGNRQYLTNPETKEIYAFDGESEVWTFFWHLPRRYKFRICIWGDYRG